MYMNFYEASVFILICHFIYFKNAGDSTILTPLSPGVDVDLNSGVRGSRTMWIRCLCIIDLDNSVPHSSGSTAVMSLYSTLRFFLKI